MKEARRYKSVERLGSEPVIEERAIRPRRNDANVVTASLWMIGISLVLFFIPLLNGLIGGFVGGLKAGNPKKAMMAALLPAVVVAIGLWVLFAVMTLPVVGLFAGTAMGLWILFADLGLFIGAAIGGAAARR